MNKKKDKKLTQSQAIKDLEKSKKELFNFRIQKINGQLKSPSKVKETKKTIARLKTFLGGQNA